MSVGEDVGKQKISYTAEGNVGWHRRFREQSGAPSVTHAPTTWPSPSSVFNPRAKQACVPLLSLGFPGGSVAKNPPAKQEAQVQSLGREDPLEKEMATHSSILAWRIPWIKEPAGYSSWGLKEPDRS